MIKKVERDNKIFASEEFLKEKYKFNIVSKILSGDEVLLYSDEENYFFARNREGKPTWIWTKDNLTDEHVLEEIKEAMSLYLTNLEYDQFTCKKEFYDYLVKTNYNKLNKKDYFELGFLICHNVKDVKNVDGEMQLATKDEVDMVSEFIFKFLKFMKITLNEMGEVTHEDAKKEAEKLIEKELLYTWKNKNNQIVCIAKYDVLNGTARIGHVYTLEEERGKGYAANLIHDLTALIIDKGIQPLLYTDYSYPASNKAYINAGYEDKGILINFSCSKQKGEGSIIEIDNVDDLNDCLNVIKTTYQDRDKKMKFSTENNHRHSNMTYEELKERFENGIRMYGYYSEEKLIAFLALEHKENEIKIRDIVVLPEYQSSGIGTKLLDFAKQQAVNCNKPRITLGMIYANEKLRVWYEKYGFKIKEIITYPGTGEVAKMEYIMGQGDGSLVPQDE